MAHGSTLVAEIHQETETEAIQAKPQDASEAIKHYRVLIDVDVPAVHIWRRDMGPRL